MSNKKYTKVEVCEIHSRLMSALGISKKIELSKLLNISTQTLKNREDRGMNGLDDVELLCNKKGLNKEWVFTGEEGMRVKQAYSTKPGSAPLMAEIKQDYDTRDRITKKINLMLEGMDEEAQRDVLKYAEEKKQLAELKAERENKKAA